LNFISIDTHLISELGHNYIYQNYLTKAAKLQSLKHIILLEKNLQTDLSNAWPTLYSPIKTPRGHIKNIIYTFRLTSSIVSAIKKITNKNEKSILFIDLFNRSIICSFFYSIIILFFLGYKIQPYVVLRYPPHKQRKELKALVRFSWVFKSVKFFSDTRQIVEEYSHVLGKNVELLPIPHVENDLKNLNSINFASLENIKCWWPGAPRKAKGLEIILNLAKLLERTSTILYVSESTPIIHSDNVFFVKNVLPRDDYITHMSTSHLILLPYDPVEYSLNSSGIFVEAVCAGKIVFVHEGTWAASELKKYNLTDFILTKDPADWLDSILKVKTLNFAGFDKIRFDYNQFHTLENFQKVLFN
jgi:hypothetical protein